MYKEMVELVQHIWEAIRTGKSDGQRLADLIVKCIRSGTLYQIIRDENGKPLLDENGEVQKAPFEFGEQIVPALVDVLLALDQQNKVETDGPPWLLCYGVRFGECKRIFISAARYATERLGMEYAPKAAETTKFRLDSALSAEDIVAVLRKKIDSEKMKIISSLLA